MRQIASFSVSSPLLSIAKHEICQCVFLSEILLRTQSDCSGMMKQKRVTPPSCDFDEVLCYSFSESCTGDY